jgi:hypothetical protein
MLNKKRTTLAICKNLTLLKLISIARDYESISLHEFDDTGPG